MKQGNHYAKGFVQATCSAAAIASAVFFTSGAHAAQDHPVKPPIRGLVSIGAFKFVGSGGDPVNTLEPINAKPGIFGGIMIVASWAQLQPEATSEIENGNVIDKAMAEVRGYNARHPDKPLAVRLRIWGGFKAPGWAMKLGGPPIAAVHNNKNRRVGRFWSPEYRQAWARLQERLAAKYDSWPLIREVSMTSRMSFTAEPFFSPSEDSVQKPIRAAGFTEPAYKECLRNGLADYAPWKSTRIVLSVNPLRTGLNQGPGDPEFTEQIMRDCRKTLGVRCVFDNHNLDTDLARPLVRIYALMKQLGPRSYSRPAERTRRTSKARSQWVWRRAQPRSSCGRTTGAFLSCRTRRSSAGRRCSRRTKRADQRASERTRSGTRSG